MPEPLDDLKQMLSPIYNSQRRWSYEEECLLLLLIRVPGYVDEVKTVLEYWNSCSGRDKKFFPSSMTRLLSDWTGILDKAALSKQNINPEPTASEKIQWQFELKRVEKRQSHIRNQYSDCTTWSEEDRVEFKKLRERRKALITCLGLIV
jgi:hypothetical protein